MATNTGEAPAGQHIFHAKHLTELALRWKECTAAAQDLSAKGREEDARDKAAEAMDLLEEIIVGSTSMFERLAQYEGFPNTVDLDTLVQAAREKVARWLQSWNPKLKADGGLFSWFSTCAKHAFLSELSKVNQHRKRIHATSDSLEKWYGEEDHAATKDDASNEAKERLKDITARWGDPVTLGAVRFVLDSLVDERPQDRQLVIFSLCCAYGLSPEMGKFFYSWGLFALRDAMYDKIHVPFTQQDILRHKETHSHLVDLLDIIGWEPFKRLCATLGGTRFKLPTMAQLGRWHEEYQIAREIDHTNLDPTSVGKVARKYKRTDKSAQELYEEMTYVQDPNRSGEHYVYGEDSE